MRRKPIDEFRRTPPRRYDREPQEETRIEHAGRFRKRYFDMPRLRLNALERTAWGAVCAGLLLIFCNGSAPLGDVPNVQERFADWASRKNEETVKTLLRADNGLVVLDDGTISAKRNCRDIRP